MSQVHFLKRRMAKEPTLRPGDHVVVKIEALHVFRYTGSTEGGIWVGRRQQNLRVLLHSMHGHTVAGRVVKERDQLGHYHVEVDRIMSPRGAIQGGGMMAWRVLAHESECERCGDAAAMLFLLESHRERLRMASGHPSVKPEILHS